MATEKKPMGLISKALVCAGSVCAVVPQAAMAQTPADCVKLGGTGLVLAVSNYNPFSGSEQASAAGELVLERASGFAGAFDVKVQLLDFNSPSGVAAIGQTGLAGVTVTSGATGMLRSGSADFSAGSNWVSRSFRQNTSQITIPGIRLRVPGSLDVAASNSPYSETVDVVVECSQAGQTWTQTLSAGAQFQVAVQSRLRATVVGNVNAGSIAIDPVSGSAGSGLRVASSGPFSLEVGSDNGFELRLPGGNPNAPSDQRVSYTVSMAGGSFTGTTPAAGRKRQCGRTGLAGETLPVDLELASNANRLRSGDYSDVLTVTVTPNVVGPASGCTS